jgi:hypothetical protein
MCFDWVNERIKRLTWQDLAIDKIAVIAFAFLVAKFFPAVLSARWYWYAIVLVVCKGYVVSRIYKKRAATFSQYPPTTTRS